MKKKIISVTNWSPRNNCIDIGYIYFYSFKNINSIMAILVVKVYMKRQKYVHIYTFAMTLYANSVFRVLYRILNICV